MTLSEAVEEALGLRLEGQNFVELTMRMLHHRKARASILM